jgi:hypothetical protein
MLLGLIKDPPLLDAETSTWMMDVYAWALRNLDAQVFFHSTPLVTPTNAHFPGQGSSAHEMAALILGQVAHHAGMGHWPMRIMDNEQWTEQAAPTLSIEGPLRIQGTATPLDIPDEQKLVVLYAPEQLRDPQVVIANCAHTLAHYLGSMATEPPPGGAENWPHITELLAVFLGFGVMMANTAFTTKIRSCSSCASPAVERTNYLSQYDLTYALAIFSAAKDVPRAEVLTHLKSALRPFYKKAHKEVTGNQAAIKRLQDIAQQM